MNDLLVNILASAVWALLGALMYRVYGIISNVLPRKKLWQLRDPSNVIISVSSNRAFDGYYLRPGAGAGHMQALGLVLVSLTQTYKGTGAQNVSLSTDKLSGRIIEYDLILLGGPEHNQLTERFLHLVGDECPAYQSGNVISWRNSNGEREEYLAETNEKGEIVQDYAIVMRTANPFSTVKGTVVLLSGCHTYGTLAAARYFTENVYDAIRNKSKKYEKNFVAIIGTHVYEGWPHKFRLLKYTEI